MFVCRDQPRLVLASPKLGSSPGGGSSPEGMLSARSLSAPALCNLLLDAHLEGLLHGWIQRRVCRHLLAHPSRIVVLRGGRVRKLRAWPLLERPPALSLGCALKKLHLTQPCQGLPLPRCPPTEGYEPALWPAEDHRVAGVALKSIARQFVAPSAGGADTPL